MIEFTLKLKNFLLNNLFNTTSIGSVDKGVVEVTNCFCVPHKEHDDQVEAELSYALDVYELNRRVNPSENIVGMCIKNKFYNINSMECICHV